MPGKESAEGGNALCIRVTMTQMCAATDATSRVTKYSSYIPAAVSGIYLWWHGRTGKAYVGSDVCEVAALAGDRLCATTSLSTTGLAVCWSWIPSAVALTRPWGPSCRVPPPLSTPFCGSHMRDVRHAALGCTHRLGPMARQRTCALRDT